MNKPHISEATVAEVKWLDGLATKGPLEYDSCNTIFSGSGEDYEIACRIADHPQDGEWGDLNNPEINRARGEWYAKSGHTAQFFALARTALPDAIREIERLRGLISEAHSYAALHLAEPVGDETKTLIEICTVLERAENAELRERVKGGEK